MYLFGSCELFSERGEWELDKQIFYTFYGLGKAESDRSVIQMMEKREQESGFHRFFHLAYTPPFQPFEGIKQFQKMAAYRPFVDGLWKRKVVAVNLEEWIGHEKENYLEIFLRFLYDYDSFFIFEYIFLTRDVKEQELEPLKKLVKQYLGEEKRKNYEEDIQLL